MSVTVDQELCPRFTAVVLRINPKSATPEFIHSFLEKADIRSINIAVDISNYLMLQLGQPVHMFDYDKIKGGVMKLRESKKGETVALLDEKTYTLPGGDIVIEDGEGRLIDLCGIMGGKLSEVDATTQRVILFVQNYKRSAIRKTSMITGARSVAASYFERGLDTNRVEPTCAFGIELLQKYADGVIESDLIDLYPKKTETVSVATTVTYINDRIGKTLAVEEMRAILSSLGFEVNVNNDTLTITVPFWRALDVRKPEDIVEEVARIYGYDNLGEKIPPFAFVEDAAVVQKEQYLTHETELKHFMRDRGFYEVYTYSAYSKALAEQFKLSLKDHVTISNPISSEIVYMRLHLIPSLYAVLQENAGLPDVSIFEMASVYKKQKNDLPLHESHFAAITTQGYAEIKGIMDNCCRLFGCAPTYETVDNQNASIVINGTAIGKIGVLPASIVQASGRYELAYFEIELLPFMKAYSPVRPFPKKHTGAYIEDLTYIYNGTDFVDIVGKLKKAFPEVYDVGWVGEYENNMTIRIYSMPTQNQSLLSQIITYMEQTLHLTIKKQ